MNEKVSFAIGVILIIASIFGGFIGYDLKGIGQQYNHIWVLSLLALYAGFDRISKYLK